MWVLYVVRCADASLYCGITKNLEQRLYDHNNTKRGAKYTRSRRPVELVIQLDFSDRSSVAKAEAKFKKLSTDRKRVFVQSRADLLEYLS